MKLDSIARRVRDAVHHIYPFLAVSEINVTIENDVVNVDGRSPFLVPMRGMLDPDNPSYLFLTPFDADDDVADDDHVYLTIRINLSTIEE